jgi:hypothetical protein
MNLFVLLVKIPDKVNPSGKLSPAQLIATGAVLAVIVAIVVYLFIK